MRIECRMSSTNRPDLRPDAPPSPAAWPADRPVPLPRQASVVFGSAFFDPRDPHSGLGNPFAVVLGADVGTWNTDQRQVLARRTGTPEAVYIDAVHDSHGPDGACEYKLDLTVLTPTGKALGACADAQAVVQSADTIWDGQA
jgi:hypothetical protein